MGLLITILLGLLIFLLIIGALLAIFLAADIIATEIFNKDIIEVIGSFWNRLRGR